MSDDEDYSDGVWSTGTSSWEELVEAIANHRIVAARYGDYTRFQRAWLIEAAVNARRILAQGWDAITHPQVNTWRMTVGGPTLIVVEGPVEAYAKVDQVEVDPLLIDARPWERNRIGKTIRLLGSNTPFNPPDISERGCSGIYTVTDGSHRIARAQHDGHPTAVVTATINPLGQAPKPDDIFFHHSPIGVDVAIRGAANPKPGRFKTGDPTVAWYLSLGAHDVDDTEWRQHLLGT